MYMSDNGVSVVAYCLENFYFPCLCTYEKAPKPYVYRVYSNQPVQLHRLTRMSFSTKILLT